MAEFPIIENKGRFVKGHIPWSKGKKGLFKQSKEWKLKMSELHRTRKRSPHSEATRKKMSGARKGKEPWNKGLKGVQRHSEETRIKMGKSRLGKQPRDVGFKASKETKKKMSESHKGDKSHCWLGGISFEAYTVDWNRALRRNIRERDNHTCKLCKEKTKDISLDVHHIDYNKKNCDSSNLITLCHSCHSRTNHNRNYWTKLIKGFITNG